MIKSIIAILMTFTFFSTQAVATVGQTVDQIFYCGDDFAIHTDAGNWYVVLKSAVGEKKQDHFLSMAMFSMATGSKTGNFFPGDPLSNWCGSKNFLPITSFSIKTDSPK